MSRRNSQRRLNQTLTNKDEKQVTYVKPLTEGQEDLIAAIAENTVVLVCGPSGTGKTAVSVMMACQYLAEGKTKKILLARPIVSASVKNLGALPGDIREKIDPYLMPVIEQMKKYYPVTEVNKMIRDGIIELAPLELLRGRTFDDCFMIMDECFTADTKISVLEVGKPIPIKRIVDGFNNGKLYTVLSYNEKLQKNEYKKIISTRTTDGLETLKVYINNKEHPIECTPNHPFYIFENGAIIQKPANELQSGDVVIRAKKPGSQNAGLFIYGTDLLLGTLLGDGHLSVNKQSNFACRIGKNHGLAQYNYMKFCEKLYNGKEKKGLISGYTGKPLCGFSTKSIIFDKNLFNAIRPKITEDISKWFTIRTLAMWYMDDGSRSDKCATFHTEGYSYEENVILQKILLDKFGVVGTIHPTKTYYRLGINTESSEKLFEMLAEYIHPDLQYKLPESHQGYFNESLYKITNLDELSIGYIDGVELGSKQTVYNLEIEDNNNYYAENYLVHNCQNATFDQITMFLTRLGKNSRCVINGDTEQSDLTKDSGGFAEYLNLLENVDDIEVVELLDEDIVRNKIIKDILKAARARKV